MAESASVLYARPADGVALITVNRPERLNALNMDVKRRIEAFLTEAGDDPTVAVIVITGGADVFVAGTDLAEMVEMTPRTHQELGTNALFVALRACAKPLIAAVEGYALGGGCELAMACDMIVAGAGAKFGQPEIRVGIMPGAGGTQILPRVAGMHRAMHLLLTGDQFVADEAYAMGLVSELAPAGEALDKAIALAKRIRAMPPIAVRAVKQAVRNSGELPMSQGLVAERAAFEGLFATVDQREGMTAFLEKRRPSYTGR